MLSDPFGKVKDMLTGMIDKLKKEQAEEAEHKARRGEMCREISRHENCFFEISQQFWGKVETSCCRTPSGK